jgi:hypothetical protein
MTEVISEKQRQYTFSSTALPSSCLTYVWCPPFSPPDTILAITAPLPLHSPLICSVDKEMQNVGTNIPTYLQSTCLHTDTCTDPDP